MTNPKTKHLELNLIDRTSPTTTYLNLQTNLDDNWEKIDQALGSETVDAEPVAVTLKQGLQVVSNEANRQVPLQLKSLKGRTLVNLLGRDGNCESAAGFLAAGVSISATTDAVDGKASINLAATLNTPIEHYAVLGAEFADGGSAPIEPNSYYLLIGLVKPVLGQAALRYIIFDSMGTALMDNVTSTTSDNTKWTTIISKFQTPSNAWRSEIRAQVFNDSGDSYYIADGENANFDSIRLYEISQAEYNALDSMTADQVAAKYPYVDDMKSIVNPYVIRYGKNLLPPFTEWNEPSTAAKYTVTDPYALVFTDNETNNVALSVRIPVVENQTYTITVNSGGLGKIGLNGYDINGLLLDSLVGPPFGVYTQTDNLTFTTPSGAAVVKVGFYRDGNVAEPLTFTNPMLNIGPEPLPFVPREDNMQVAVTSLASSVDGSVYDELYQKDGRLYKFSRFKTIDLDGSLAWTVGAEAPGFKRMIAALPSPSLRVNDGWFVKFNGDILKRYSGAYDSADIGYHDKLNVVVTVRNVESGWGDSYRPSDDEIKAYFYGWKMYEASSGHASVFNGTGTKAWVGRYNNGVGSAGTTDWEYVKGLVDAGVLGWAIGQSRYKLQYQLATPTLEEITSEGQISLHEGLNQVEVGAGMIVREKANPALFNAGTDGYFYIINSDYNAGGQNLTSSRLKYRLDRFIDVYCDGRSDYKWTYEKVSSAYGNEQAKILQASFDIESPYSVTYTALDKYLLTGPVKAIDCQYPINMKTVVNELVSRQVDLARRVGVLETQKAGKDQPQWIAPTLLNGWENSDSINSTAGYLLTTDKLVKLKGLLKNGSTYNFAIIFYLPQGYRPKENKQFIVSFGTGYCRIIVMHDGKVRIYGASGGTIDLSLDGIIFVAEQ